MRVLLLVVALLGAACEAEVPSCPGDAQGTLSIGGGLDAAATTCAFPVSGSAAFVATVAFTGASTAVLCVQRPLAASRFGSRSGDAIAVQFTLAGVAVGNCPCAVNVQESLTGTLQRTPGGVAVGFQGTLVDRITRSADAAACYAGADAAAVAAACPAAPDPLAAPPSDGGCDAVYDLATAGP